MRAAGLTQEVDVAFFFNLGDPFETLFNFQQALDQLRASAWLDAGLSGQGSFPPLNAFRKGHDIVVIAEVPGVKKSDLQLEIKGDTIRIAGTKNAGPQEKASVHRRERRSGRFDRTITLPIEVDADRVKAECRNGILALFLPRAEHDKPRAIAIN
jgi:HSP20 family protein